MAILGQTLFIIGFALLVLALFVRKIPPLANRRGMVLLAAVALWVVGIAVDWQNVSAAFMDGFRAGRVTTDKRK